MGASGNIQQRKRPSNVLAFRYLTGFRRIKPGHAFRLNAIAVATQLLAVAHAQTTINPGTITTSQILNGQTVTVVGGTSINVPNVPNNGWAILAREGSHVTFDPTVGPAAGPIQLIGNTALGHALQVQQESSAQGSGLEITTNGPGEYGIELHQNGSVNLSNTNITTNGAASGGIGAYGLGVSDTSSATLSNSSVTTKGDVGNGVISFGGTITLINVPVRTESSSTTLSAYGVNAQSGGQITMNGGSVLTNS